MFSVRMADMSESDAGSSITTYTGYRGTLFLCFDVPSTLWPGRAYARWECRSR